MTVQTLHYIANGAGTGHQPLQSHDVVNTPIRVLLLRLHLDRHVENLILFLETNVASEPRRLLCILLDNSPVQQEKPSQFLCVVMLTDRG